MKEKACIKCGVTKALTEFYVHPQMGDGRLNKCKECTKKDVRANYLANAGRYKEYHRVRSMLPHNVLARERYRSTPEGQAAIRRSHANYMTNHPEKRAAHIAVGNAIRDGALKRHPCEVCGALKVEAHHDDYTKQLDVRWLCKKHHCEVHEHQRKEVA